MSCPDCFKGHVHDGAPTGREEKIHGLDTYIAEPPNGAPPKAIIIIVPDGAGWRFVNNRLLADTYAAGGDYLVYLPDFMDGRSAPEWLFDVFPHLTDNSSIMDWVWKPWYVAQVAYGVVPFLLHNRFHLAWPRVRPFFAAVRAGEGAKLAIGAVGLCWGGKHVFTLVHPESVSEDGRPLVDAVFTGHPSGMAVPDDIRKIIKPVSVAIGDQDMVLSMKQVELIRAMWQEEDLKNVPTEVVVYPGAGHGFCARADPKNENQFRQAGEAEQQAIKWFKKHLG